MFNDYEQCPIKGNPKQEATPGLASGFNEGNDALPGGMPKQDNKQADKSAQLLNDQQGNLGMTGDSGGGV